VGDSDRLRVGEFVLAVGNPLGLVGAVTTGIIHTLGSTQHQPWIQADVRLAPGNSGGALANAQGQVIGINTMIVNGCGFAIPSNVVQRFLNDQSDRPYLGVSLQPVMVPVDRRPAYGLLITEVESDSPAEAANLQTGDVLIGVRGASFQTPNELFEILEHSHTDDGLPLTVLRGGQRRVAEVILYSREPEGVAA
jgi:serine protease Do